MNHIESPQSEITDKAPSADIARSLAQALKDRFNSHFFATTNGVAGHNATHSVYVKGKHPRSVIGAVKTFAEDYLKKEALAVSA